MNGILNILKPPGMTSFDVTAHIRGLAGTRKAGHTGTLDPMAAGVLTVCLGNATGAIEFLVDKDKLYRAELTLGITTDTQDSSGSVISEMPVDCSDERIRAAVASFIGSYAQLPPMYSALKVNGRKLYELAREGVSVDRAPREVEIYSAGIVKIYRSGRVKVLFDIHCSKGTYIRTLCSDIGERLGCGGHMSFLLRKRAGAFGLEDAATLEEIRELAAEGRLQSAMTEVPAAFENLKAIELDAVQEKRFVNGVRFGVGGDAGCGLVRVYGAGGRFLALGEIYDSGGKSLLKSRKFFYS
jgi:tRNA pseudouridine55 synthase